MNLSREDLVRLRGALAQRADRLNHLADEMLPTSGMTVEQRISRAEDRNLYRAEAAEFAKLMHRVHAEIVARSEAGEVSP